MTMITTHINYRTKHVSAKKTALAIIEELEKS